MCGIVYAKSFTNRPINDIVTQQYRKQRSRGSEGFGVYDAEYRNMVKTPKETKILNWLKRYPANEILFHHRYPTSTANVKNAAHPFSTKDYFDTQYVLVHNGVLYNDDDVAEEHFKKGIAYTSVQPDGSFNDSEALLWDVAHYLEGKQDEIKAHGSIAFICLALNEKTGDKLYFGRNAGNPLHMHFTKKRLMLSSEGKGQQIDTNQLYCYDYQTGRLTKTALTIPEYSYHSPTYSAAGGTPNSGFRPNDTTFGGDNGYPYSNFNDRSDDYDFFDALEQFDEEKMAIDIKVTLNRALVDANGYFELAYLMLGEDIEKLADRDLNAQTWYDTEVTSRARDLISEHPLWDKSKADCQHPTFTVDQDKTLPTPPANAVATTNSRAGTAQQIGFVLSNQSDRFIERTYPLLPEGAR